MPCSCREFIVCIDIVNTGLSIARAAALPPVSARCGCLGRGGFSATDTAELCQPRRSGKHGGKEIGNTQIEIEAVPVQSTASTKDFNRADISGRSQPETGYQFHWQGNGCPVRQLDRQRALTGEVLDPGSARLAVRRTAPDLGRANEIRTQLFLYPARQTMRPLCHVNQTLGLLSSPKLSQMRMTSAEVNSLSPCSEWWAVQDSDL
jgi:hypothetical protein